MFIANGVGWGVGGCRRCTVVTQQMFDRCSARTTVAYLKHESRLDGNQRQQLSALLNVRRTQHTLHLEPNVRLEPVTQVGEKRPR